MDTDFLIKNKALPSSRVPTCFGEFIAYPYESIDGACHLALVKGEIKGKSCVLTRVHSECLTGDVFGSQRCDCGMQLKQALARIEEEGTGVVLYLRGHEGRGIGLFHKISAYSLQDKGFDTATANIALGFPIDARNYKIAAEILLRLNITSIRLLSNNPEKQRALLEHGVVITERIPLLPHVTPDNHFYLKTKQEKMGHLFELPSKIS